MLLRNLVKEPSLFCFVDAPSGDAGGGAAPSGAPSAGGDAAPAAPSGGTDSASPAGEESSGETMFDGFGEIDDDVVEVAEPSISTEPPAPVAAPPAQPQPGAEAPKPPVVPPVVAPAQAAPAPAEAQPGQPAAAPAAPQSPRGLAEALDQHRDAIIDALAADRFQVTQEEADSLLADPVRSLPRFAAKLYYQAQQSSLLAIEQHVPKMVMQIVRDMRAHDEAEAAFYGKHKALDKSKHSKDVAVFAKAFRQQNPNIGMDDLHSLIVGAVMAKYGLQAPATNGAQQPGQQVQPSGAPPFVPVRPGAGGVRVSTTPDDNPFMGLGQAFDDD